MREKMSHFEQNDTMRVEKIWTSGKSHLWLGMFGNRSELLILQNLRNNKDDDDDNNNNDEEVEEDQKERRTLVHDSAERLKMPAHKQDNQPLKALQAIQLQTYNNNNNSYYSVTLWAFMCFETVE